MQLDRVRPEVVISNHRHWVGWLAVAVSITLLGGCKAAVTEADDAARYAGQLVDELGLTKTSTSAVEDWLRVTKARTGLPFEGIVGKVAELRPAVRLTPPIRSAADDFTTRNLVPQQLQKQVRDVFIGTMCDTASSIAQGKTVDEVSIVQSAIKSSAASFSEFVELTILQSELEAKVREFARVKSASEAAAVADDISFMLECFALGKVAT